MLPCPPQGGRKHPQQEFLQVDTTNILFICGGAFAGLERIISSRGKGTSIGFGAKVSAPEDRRTGEVFREVEPEDLLKFGLIPEFVGRLPVIATLEDLDEAALVKILSEPKNALVKQYQRLFEMEGVELSMHEDALGAVARKAIQRKTGARGLRSILEAILLDTMYDLPGLEGVDEVVISDEVVEGKAEAPLHLLGSRCRCDRGQRLMDPEPAPVRRFLQALQTRVACLESSRPGNQLKINTRIRPGLSGRAFAPGGRTRLSKRVTHLRAQSATGYPAGAVKGHPL